MLSGAGGQNKLKWLLRAYADGNFGELGMLIRKLSSHPSMYHLVYGDDGSARKRRRVDEDLD